MKQTARHTEHVVLAIAAVLGVAVFFYCAVLLFGPRATADTNFSITILPGYECYDGQDNDGDGDTDYPADTECSGYTDDSEAPEAVPPIATDRGGSGRRRDTGEVLVSGWAAPREELAIYLDGEAVHEMPAGVDGSFSVRLTTVPVGSYAVGVMPTDFARRVPMYAKTVEVVDGEVAEAMILVPAIVEVSAVQVDRGGLLTVQGYAAPGALADFWVDGVFMPHLSMEVGTNGAFAVALESSDLAVGEHTIQVAISLNGLTSGLSIAKEVIVSEGIIEIPTACNADVNDDGSVNLVDFVALRAWFRLPLTDEAKAIESRCFNGDQTVDMIDFSILTYYWTG